MKRLLTLIPLALISIPLYAASTLVDFNAVSAAISQGDTIRIVTDYSACQTSAPMPLPPGRLLGSFSASVIGLTDHTIRTSMTHFTRHDPLYPNQSVFEYTSYTITPDNIMQVTLHVLDAKDYQLLGEPMQFTCTLGQAVKIYA